MNRDELRHAACIVGTARRTWNEPSEKVPEPLGMWEEVARRAIDDVGTRSHVLGQIDHLGVVHCQAWAYDDPVARLGQRLGRPGVPGTTSIVAGTSPQRLLDAAAERMARGEISAALVVGAEALATQRRYASLGEPLPWSHPSDQPPLSRELLETWHLPTELAHGVLPAWLTFALLEQARWAARGARTSDREAMVETMASLSRVAAVNPDAWFRTARSSAELRSTERSNRPVATPYTKHMVAFPNVDMAAANLLVTHELADRWGVPEDHRVYLRGWGFARDASHLAARGDLASSPAMRAAQGNALARAGMAVDEIDVFDLYSCFASAVAFARDALGLEPDDPRPLTVTGGLPYHGGPGSNYMSHSISHVVSRLRSGEARNAMVTGVGMHMAKHVAAVYSTEPGTAVPAPDDDAQANVLPEEATDPIVVERVTGPVVLKSATVVHGRDGGPDHVVAICGLPDGRRCYARTDDPDVISAVTSDGWIETPGHVTPKDDGTHELSI